MNLWMYSGTLRVCEYVFKVRAGPLLLLDGDCTTAYVEYLLRPAKKSRLF